MAWEDFEGRYPLSVGEVQMLSPTEMADYQMYCFMRREGKIAEMVPDDPSNPIYATPEVIEAAQQGDAYVPTGSAPLYGKKPVSAYAEALVADPVAPVATADHPGDLSGDGVEDYKDLGLYAAGLVPAAAPVVSSGVSSGYYGSCGYYGSFESDDAGDTVFGWVKPIHIAAAGLAVVLMRGR